MVLYPVPLLTNVGLDSVPLPRRGTIVAILVTLGSVNVTTGVFIYPEPGSQVLICVITPDVIIALDFVLQPAAKPLPTFVPDNVANRPM